MSSRSPSIRALSTHDAAREAGQDGRQDRAPWALRRLPTGRAGGAPSTVCRDPASDRSAPTRTAPGMSWVAAMRDPRQRRCVHDQRRPAQTRPKRQSQSPKDRFGARSALLPMRPGLPAAPEGRKLDRQRPASGECWLKSAPTCPALPYRAPPDLSGFPSPFEPCSEALSGLVCLVPPRWAANQWQGLHSVARTD